MIYHIPFSEIDTANPLILLVADLLLKVCKQLVVFLCSRGQTSQLVLFFQKSCAVVWQNALVSSAWTLIVSHWQYVDDIFLLVERLPVS